MIGGKYDCTDFDLIASAIVIVAWLAVWDKLSVLETTALLKLFLEFTQDGAENRKHPARGNSVGRNTSVMEDVRGEWSVRFRMTGRLFTTVVSWKATQNMKYVKIWDWWSITAKDPISFESNQPGPGIWFYSIYGLTETGELIVKTSPDWTSLDLCLSLQMVMSEIGSNCMKLQNYPALCRLLPVV